MLVVSQYTNKLISTLSKKKQPKILYEYMSYEAVIFLSYFNSHPSRRHSPPGPHDLPYWCPSQQRAGSHLSAIARDANAGSQGDGKMQMAAH